MDDGLQIQLEEDGCGILRQGQVDCGLCSTGDNKASVKSVKSLNLC